MDERAKHTPTPWTCHSGSVYQDGPDVWPKGNKDGVPIAKMDRDTEHTQPTERDSNALFITHACNLYDDLVRTLKAFHSCHRAFSSSENWTALDDEVRAEAEALIERADSEPAARPTLYRIEIDVMDFDGEDDSERTLEERFSTKAERDAFLSGVESGMGWQEITDTRETEEDA